MNIGTLHGEIRISTESINRAVEAINRLEQTMSNAASRIESALSGLNRATKEQATTTEKASQKAEKSAAAYQRQEQAMLRLDTQFSTMINKIRNSNAGFSESATMLQNLQSAYSSAREEIQNSEGRTRQISAAFTEFGTETLDLNNRIREHAEVHKEATAAQKEAAAAQKKAAAAQKKAENAAKQAEQTEVARISTLSSARNQVNSLTSAIQNSSNVETEKVSIVNEMSEAYSRYENAVNESGARSVEAARAKERLTETMNRARISARQAAQRDFKAFNFQMQNLTKSVQLALGPLSGVAARITALTALFNRNVPAIAAVVAGLTGFTVALSRTLRIGREVEVQNVRIEAILNQMGDRANVTADEISAMARVIGRDTLASAHTVREAGAILATYNNITRDGFSETLIIAQGMSDVFGGSLAENTRRIGRLLQNPARNLDSLRRRGVEFTREQEEMIRTLQESGDILGAQAIVFEELATFKQAATDVAGTLAGSMDTLGERVTQFFERIDEGGRVTQKVQRYVDELTDRVVYFMEETITADVAAKAFKNTISAIGDAVLVLANNADLIVTVLGVVLFRALVTASLGMGRFLMTITGVSTGFSVLRAATVAVGSALGIYTRSAQTATVASAGLAASLRAIPFVNYISLIGTVAAGAALLTFRNRETGDSFDNLGTPLQDHIDRIKALGTAYHDTARAAKEGARIEATVAEQASNRIRRQIEEEERALEKALAKEKEIEEATRQRGDDGWVLKTPKEADALKKAREDITKYTSSLELLNAELDDSESNLEHYLNRYKELRKALEESESQTDSVEESNKKLINTLKELENQYVDSSIEDFIKDQEKARTSLEQLGEEAGWSQERIDRLFAAMREADPRLEGVDNAVQRFVDMQRETTEAINRLRGIEPAVNWDYINQLQDVHINGLKEIAAQTGINIEGLRTEEEIRRRIAERMTEEARQQQRLSDIMRDDAAARQTIFEAQDEFGVEAIRQEYEARRQRIMQESNIEEDFRKELLQRQATAEMQEMRNLAESIAQEEFQFNEHINKTKEQQITDFYERRREVISEALAGEEELIEKFHKIIEQKEKAHQEKIKSDRESIIEQAMSDYGVMAQNIENIFKVFGEGLTGTLAALSIGMSEAVGLMGAVLGESHTMYKRFAQGQAIIAGALAITKAYSDGVGGLQGIATASLIAARVGAELATIEAQRFATGGFVSGPGTSTSDSVPAMLSRGEYVVRADAVRQLGVGALNSINSGNLPHLRDGGFVGRPSPGFTGPAVEINDYRSSGADIETQETTDPDGQRRLKLFIRDAVRENMASSRHDRDMEINFGVQRRAKLR